MAADVQRKEFVKATLNPLPDKAVPLIPEKRQNQWFLLGVDRSGMVHIIRGNQVLVVSGNLSRVLSISSTNSERRTLAQQIHSTSGACLTKENRKTYDCVHVGSSARFILRVERVTSHTPQSPGSQKPVALISCDKKNPMSTALNEKKVGETIENRDNETLVRELNQVCVQAQLPEGHQPTRVSMTTEQERELFARISAARSHSVELLLVLSEVICLTKLSAATIYRQIKLNRFPSQIKRGRKSLWTLSSLDVYSRAD